MHGGDPLIKDSKYLNLLKFRTLSDDWLIVGDQPNQVTISVLGHLK